MSKKFQGFEITEQDIDSALRYLIYTKGQKEATREDAVQLLQDTQAIMRMFANKIVEDEESGKITTQESETPQE